MKGCCYQCAKRHLFCHSDCQDRAKELKALEELRQAKKEANTWIVHGHGGNWRMRQRQRQMFGQREEASQC